MIDTKTWWQSRIIWMQIVAAAFALLSAFHCLPADIDQEQVVTGIMAFVAIVTVVLRMRSTHAIGKPDTTGIAPLLAVALMCGMPLSGCVTTEGATRAASAIERAEAAYTRIRTAAELALPLLPPDHAARVRLGIALADRAIAAARVAATAAEQLAQMREVERQAEAIATASGQD